MGHGEIGYIEVGGRRIAYRARDGAAPTLLFLPGYASDMEGTKALALDAFAERRQTAMLRFDYSGTGSSGGRFEDGMLDRWLEEALAAIDELSQGPLIIVGSSMGGWIALHLALLRRDRVQALVGIAAAPDFTDWGFTPEQAAQLTDEGRMDSRDSGNRDSGSCSEAISRSTVPSACCRGSVTKRCRSTSRSVPCARFVHPMSS